MHGEFLSLGFDDSILLNPLDHSQASTLYSLPFPYPEYYIVVLVDNYMICNATMDLGHEANVFDTLGGNVDDYVSLG